MFCNDGETTATAGADAGAISNMYTDGEVKVEAMVAKTFMLTIEKDLTTAATAISECIVILKLK